MTDTPEFTRNDVAALKIMTKIIDRLEADRLGYEQRMNEYAAVVTSFRYANQPVTASKITANSISAAQIMHAQLNSQPVTPGSPHNLGYSIASWEPYLTQSEYETLRVWATGGDVILHVVSEQR